MRAFTVLLALLVVWLMALAGVSGCGLIPDNRPPTGSVLPPMPGQRFDVFTTARPSFAAAVNDHFGVRPTAVQPIEFPHNVHVAKGIACTDYCHDGVAEGPVAGLPSVSTCMICHSAIATDRPRIQQITQMHAKGIDLAWQRVFGYPAQSHVKFNHAPHIRAKVECTTCHGNIGEQTVAQRNVELTMGTCVNCHREKKAPDDCLVCHF